MKKLFSRRVALCAVSFCALAIASPIARSEDQTPIWADQGAAWTPAAREAFYTQDQGSRIMPLAWLKALKRADGQAFLADGLSRYGYLPNPDSRDGLPVGFSAPGLEGNQFAGMTCAACHTRQISVIGKAYRIDGGPAIVDFQSFLADLDATTEKLSSDPQTFDAFAAAVLGPTAQPDDDKQALRERVAAWRLRYHTLMSHALPDPPWGYGRLDAVSMIFNRLTGLDLGPPPSHLIPENIERAAAPVRYPFLWNASKQDKTQWPGFSDNGSDTLALPRNLGEELGVFGEFAPQKTMWRVLGWEYLNGNSANFDGLDKLEQLIKKIGPPRWPWPIDAALAARGEVVFNQTCGQCHGKADGQERFPNVKTWRTWLGDVGTDAREYDVLGRKAKSGVLTGAQIPGLVDPLGETAPAIGLLAVSVLGSILQYYVSPAAITQATQPEQLTKFHVPPSLQGLAGAYSSIKDVQNLSEGVAGAKPVYEARVLEGIWAAAPYLHNGSVPTLTELLKPAAERVPAFKIGPAYDPNAVGLAVDQPAGSSTLVTTLDCDKPLSGSSRCGHEYGVKLTGEDKKALLEFLKKL